MKHHQVSANCARCSLSDSSLSSTSFCDPLILKDFSVDPLLNSETIHTYHSLEIHIVYNEAFAVPELYFTIRHNDGTLLSPETVEQFVRGQSPHIFLTASNVLVTFYVPS